MRQFAVIGLGNFGFYLATHLYNKGYEVLAIDRSQKLVQEIKDQVSRAAVADATDIKALEALGVGQVDVAVNCIGTVVSDSILATLTLLDIGVKRVLAKATSESHARILKKIGAAETFFPEKDLAVSLAERLHNPNMLDYLPFIEGYSIQELHVPPDFAGKALMELDLINRYGIQIVAVKGVGADHVNLIPTGQTTLKKGEIIIVIGPNESLEKLRTDK